MGDDMSSPAVEPKREQTSIVKVGREAWTQMFAVPHKVRLINILKNLHTSEVKIYSDASREFIELLDGESGGEVLWEYVQESPRLVELVEAWRLHREKPGMAYILSLFATVLGHPDGRLRRHGLVKKNLDGVARMILEDKEKMGDVLQELNSGESRRQNSALDLLAAIVRRGGGLASEIAERFDFKMAILPQLAGTLKKKGGGRDGGHRRKIAETGSTRRSFIGFAMSFLEVGNPRLLRWVLQQKEVYSGVLRGIGNDDAETVIYVLSTLRDNVLVEESLVPPGLRSVLFGSATLEQLSLISGNQDAGVAADIAHEVLLMVCTDPKNGLMPSTNLRGNEKRLLDLMKKLKPTEVAHHKSLLLAIVSKRLSLCSAYMNEFPYSIEPRPSRSWFGAISLAADMISSAKCDGIIRTLSSNLHGLVSVDDEEVQVVLKCIVPHACSRAVINRGLLHSDDLVKHGSLRLVFESVNLLCYVIEAINDMLSNVRVKSEFNGSTKVTVKIDSFPVLTCSDAADASLFDEVHQVDEMHVKRWISLREYIQDEIRGAMPDPQVLLKLLSSASQKHQNYSQSIRKNNEQHSEPPQKKRRCDASSEVADIIIGGIDVEQDKDTPEDLDSENDHASILCEIWGLDKQDPKVKDAKVIDNVFHSKLLDVLRLYLKMMPSSFDGSFDFFRIIPPNPLNLSKEEQQSLLSLLLEYSGQPEGCWDPERVPESMYKHLQPMMYIMLHSQIKKTRDQAYILVKAAMASSGAFDLNFVEIDAWLLFLPGYEAKWCVNENLRVGASNKLSHIVIPFICDAISVIGNNLYKYQEHTRKLITKSGKFEGCSPAFSPLIVCVLQKCLRLLDSESGSMKLHEKSMISLYVCNTIHLILQSQVDVRLLRDLISAVLNERFDKFSSEEMNSMACLAEWRPLINLLHFVRISDQHNYNLFATLEHFPEFDSNSLCSVTEKVEEMLSQRQTDSADDVATAFVYSVVCAPTKDIISGFPDLLAVLKTHFPCHMAFLSSVLYQQHDYLAKLLSYWPDMLCSIRLIKDDFNVDNVNTVEGKLQNYPVTAESASMSAFLGVSPFCVLLPSALSLASSAPDDISEAYNNTLLRLLQHKLSGCSFSELTLDLRVILFWSHHLLSSYTVNCSSTLEQLCKLCSALVDSVFERIQVLTAETAHSKSAGLSSPVQHIRDILDSVLQHPVIALSLSCSLSSYQDLAYGSFNHLEEALTAFSKENLHHVDRFVLNLLSKLYDLSLVVGSSEANYTKDDGQSLLSLFATPKLLLESILLLFKDKFRLCMDKGDLGLLLPNFCMVRTLSKFVSPAKLLELANWMFSQLDNWCSTSSPAFVPTVLVCLYIADIAMEMLYCYLQQSDQRSASCLLWDLEIQNSDIIAIQRAYHTILHFATKWNIEFADHCLLKMLGRIHHTERSAGWSTEYIAFHMIVSTMAMNTPIDILHHCIFPTSKVKAKAALLLLEASPMHMSLFGQIFLEVLKKDPSALQVKDYDSNASRAQEDGAILLLPVALSYLNSHTDGDGRFAEFLEPIPIFYCGLLLGNHGFSTWKSFVTRSVFEEDFSDFAPTSVKEAIIYFSGTLLGKSVTMLSSYFTLKDMSLKKRMEIIASIFPESSELFVSDVNDINPTAGQDTMKLANELFVKIALIKLLLSPPRKSLSNELASERESKRLNKAKLNFISMLVRTLDKIVRTFPWSDSTLSQFAKEQKVICFLEYVILKNIIELSSEIQTHLNQLKSIPFLDQFIRSSLLYRFSDPITIKAIRCILAVLSQGNVPADEILELILGHSNFVSAITCSGVSERSSACNTAGGLLQPCPSILKFIDSSFMEENKMLISVAEKRKFETIRLLRLLYDLKSRQQNNNLLNESRELVFLLLSVYGATLGETDLEIFHLMNEIESSECRTIAEVDHLWGSAALKFREELKLDFSKFDTHDAENVEITERRKALFRENIPVDSKLCAKTALQYCYKRSSRASAFSLEQLRQDSSADSFEVTSQRMDMAQIYDPMFILRFSIHTLLMGYVEPTEFSRLGLLAITLVSIASPDQELRMLGYESLGTFKKSLEFDAKYIFMQKSLVVQYSASQKSKETWQLQLLLTYLQNGISEQWQRIPSVIAVFAAEASLTLLDSSHAQFTAISNFLMHSTCVNLQSIPLFPTLLRSSSVHFKAERLWMLRLLYAGSNLSDDAKIYKRGSALELALAFCSSPVSDFESKVLVLKVLKKCVKLPVLAHQLVKECGLLLWLSSCISIHREGSDGVENTCSKVTELALEVVNDLISSRQITDWLQETALEQLSAISSYLYVLVKDAKLLTGNVPLLTSVLRVITSTMRLSMKRKIYQPHFTLSLHGIFSMCQAIGGCSRSTELKLAIELGIDAILMNGPLPILSEMDKSRISMVVSRAILNIFWLHSNQSSVSEMSCEEPVRNESPLSKTLRWLVASVILGRISSISHEKSGDLGQSTNSLVTLRCLLDDAYVNVEMVDKRSANDTLAIIILYLQNHAQNSSDSLPSVVMALCLLLFDSSSNPAVNKYLGDKRGTIEMLCSKIRCPAECNPAWRWHYYQPWKDPAMQKTEVERMEEEQACRSLLIIFSNAFSAGVSDFPKLTLNDVEKCGLFQWERDSMVN
ncbi:hypothetical protein EJB05_39668 [Eragrostis curvula]|uniref:Nucleolar pre-ribosomal-associated protein 1 N-terminal domain-containing protein n=1 Tax=Eragrostis curvula TaxID=38414 RepID=A0A5J9TY68_9POAL|nr:hypothetical protein EJB05_39668 [Eragrostis curvula]